MLYYIGFFVDDKNLENRFGYLAASTKMQYIINTLESLAKKTQVVSCAFSKKGFSGATNIQLNENSNVHYFTAFNSKNSFFDKFNSLIFKIQLFFYLLVKVKKDDTVIVYHSLNYMWIIQLIKKIKKSKLILEIEEVYSNVNGNSNGLEKEYNFFKIADAYLFPSQLLDDLINNECKPSIIIYGTYSVEDEQKFSASTENNKIVHCVYAGNLNPIKGGAMASIRAAEFLPSNFYMHIIGFGSEQEINEVVKAINEITLEKKGNVSFDGVLEGKSYTEFIQKCQIGLSTQNPNEMFNSTSFPSKILSYMCNGLHVVSCRIPVVENSEISSFLSYYEKQNPSEIAKAILNVDLNDDYDGKAIISKLDTKFKIQFDNILENLEKERS